MMNEELLGRPPQGWRHRLYLIIFEADTHAGKLFDAGLMAAILTSILVVFLDSVEEIRRDCGLWLDALEWLFTILFSIEYGLRLICVRHPLRYARSLFGIIDLLSILPSYAGIFLPAGQLLIDIRVLRLLRVFRVFKLTPYLHESRILGRALAASLRKIIVFMTTLITLVIVLATVMYVVEGPENGFTSIPKSLYWAIVTLTTVGYGDVTPHTVVGQMIASVVMLLGYGILAVPTGIVSAEITAQTLRGQPPTTRTWASATGAPVSASTRVPSR